MILFSALGWVTLIGALLSVWFSRSPKIWGSLLACSVLAKLIASEILLSGVFFIAVWTFVWFLYLKEKQAKTQFLLFLLLITLALSLKFQVIEGFLPLAITPSFFVDIQTPITGLLPLALFVPLASKQKDWKAVFYGVCLGVGGILVLAILAVLLGAVHLESKIPSFPWIRYGSNLILTAVPEEAFYRGFVQQRLCTYFSHFKKGSLLALVLSSLLFTVAHLYWSPSLSLLAFVFLASLLYGWVYLFSKKIESSMIVHFLLNFCHMTFFSYHAM